ncbi:unnamed protein product, partial [Mesorhabditis belari]|uniref:Uncharacterized protein n=1 Tax=Mesorhabditis belari TaxID=2138241 RepID=A0AAF3EY78_9BILA
MQWLSVLLVISYRASAHISLTNPPARFPPLDFLDSARTKGPCGVPKPTRAEYTEYTVGAPVNISWRMQYPHQGGYRIRLLDKHGKDFDYLTNNGTFFVGIEDQTTDSVEIKFTKPCEQCTLLLERQALEWGLSYTFRSCADVTIGLTPPKDEMACSERGTLVNGQCDCTRGWEGEKCQFKAECKKDSDCGSAGLCIAQNGQLIRKICACPYGFFGHRCQRRFPADSDECFAYDTLDNDRFSQYGMFNPECFNAKELPENDTIYFRKVDKDVEIILDFATTSWVSLGWRPLELSSTCRLFPDLEGASDRRKRQARNVSEEIFESDLFDAPEFADQEGPAPKLPQNNGLLRTALEAPLHAMDCTDVVTAAVIDGRMHIRDMYSRDRSTPLDDFWYDGEDSLVGAAGIEIDGRTIVMFRRWSQEIEPTDHPLGPGPLHVIWAKGQTQGAYSHAAPSALTGSRHSNTMFYLDDFLKYHGNVNRGTTVLDFHVQVPGRPVEQSAEKEDEEKPLLPQITEILRKAEADSTPTPKTNLTVFNEDREFVGNDLKLREEPRNWTTEKPTTTTMRLRTTERVTTTKEIVIVTKKMKTTEKPGEIFERPQTTQPNIRKSDPENSGEQIFKLFNVFILLLSCFAFL